MGRYLFQQESAGEMIRLIDQEGLLNEAIDLLPPDLDTSRVRRILDIGCGPGGWVFDVAQRLPHSQVMGIDISSRMIHFAKDQARKQNRSNTRFLELDGKTVPFTNHFFDVVHARLASSFLSREEWPLAIEQFSRVLLMRGHLVLTDTNIFGPGTSNSPTLARVNELCREALTKAGFHTEITQDLEGYMLQAGFEEIQSQTYELNFSAGTSARPVMYENVSYACKSIWPLLHKHVQISQQEWEELCELGLMDMMEEGFQGRVRYLMVWGQKGIGQ